MNYDIGLFTEKLVDEQTTSIQDFIALVEKLPKYTLNIQWNIDEFNSELNKPSIMNVDANYYVQKSYLVKRM